MVRDGALGAPSPSIRGASLVFVLHGQVRPAILDGGKRYAAERKQKDRCSSC